VSLFVIGICHFQSVYYSKLRNMSPGLNREQLLPARYASVVGTDTYTDTDNASADGTLAYRNIPNF
jgi:hypothetical protein